ncbi:MAG: leucine-rich repeat domain-containing protein [Alphaproteobacteria bacterium]|nr:leucine-rich repeat domain-containing protein [Alphaproteobacteria bacterium]
MAKSIYEIIKKQNGEGFARVLRGKGLQDIPDIAHIVKYAGHSAEDAEKLFPYLWSLKEFKEQNNPTNADPFQLLDQAGYHAFEVHNLDEQNSIQHFFRHNEELCTFRDEHRYENNYMIHAIKHEVWRDPYTIKPSKNPERQDEYGTSVISIQIRKKGGFISIKNRYNHTVDNPDQTFHSNPDEIIAGLSGALKAYFDVDWQSTGITVPNGFILYNKQLLKTNFEVNNCYFGDGFYAKDGEIIDIDKNNQIQMDYFIWDNKQKKLLNPSGTTDGFVQVFNNFVQGKKVTVSGKAPNQTITVDGEKIIELGNNQIVTLNLPGITDIPPEFLALNKSIQQINLPNVKTIGNRFLNHNENLQKLSLPEAVTIGNFALSQNTDMQELSLPNVTEIGHNFAYHNQILHTIFLPNVKTVSTRFLFCNNMLDQISLPNVTTIGDDFLHCNKQLKQISLPNVTTIGDDFLYANEQLQQISLPNATTIGNGFLHWNEQLKQISLPNVTTIGDGSLYANKQLQQISLPNVATIGACFLHHNKQLKQISLPNVTTISNDFLRWNEQLKQISLPKLTELPMGFMINNNQVILNIPKLESIIVDRYPHLQSQPTTPAINTPITDIFPERRSKAQRFKHAIKQIYDKIKIIYRTHGENNI